MSFAEPIVLIMQERLMTDLRELVHRTVEETPGGLIGAECCERVAEHEAYRAGGNEWRPATTSGEVTIRMPSPRACCSRPR